MDHTHQFVNRTKALALYRQFIRATKSLGDARTRWETMEWIRNDFERNRAVVDSVSTYSAAFSADTLSNDTWTQRRCPPRRKSARRCCLSAIAS